MQYCMANGMFICATTCNSITTNVLLCKVSFDIHVIDTNNMISPTNDALKAHESSTCSKFEILVFHTLGFLKWTLGVLWSQNMDQWVHTMILLFLDHLLAYKIKPWGCLL